MAREEVFDGLKEIMASVKPSLDLGTVTFDSKLVSELGIDSLSMLLLSLAVEHKFNMRFENTEKPFDTVGEVCDYVINALQ